MNLKLPNVDALRREHVAGYDVIIHNDHRFALIPALIAQRSGQLATPATLVSFDRHHDALDLRRGKESLNGFCTDSLAVDELVSVCQTSLSQLDDDWIKAGMELGIIGDAVIFGSDDLRTNPLEHYTDALGREHHIFMYCLPGGALAYQGYLSDVARRGELQRLWSVLGWDPRDGGFQSTSPRWWLSIDLDLFVVAWREYLVPWPDEVYRTEFSTESGYGPVSHWNGCKLFHEFLRRADLITIAREPNHCGGETKCNQIWGDVQRLVLAPCL